MESEIALRYISNWVVLCISFLKFHVENNLYLLVLIFSKYFIKKKIFFIFERVNNKNKKTLAEIESSVFKTENKKREVTNFKNGNEKREVKIPGISGRSEKSISFQSLIITTENLSSRHFRKILKMENRNFPFPEILEKNCIQIHNIKLHENFLSFFQNIFFI